MATEALEQATENSHVTSLHREDVSRIFKYGVAFCKKRIQVAFAEDVATKN